MIQNEHRLKGEVTVFLSMLLVVILIFIGALLESVRVQHAKSYSRRNSELALQSVFAEYQTELLEEFDIFVIESTYETGTYDVDKLIQRLEFYGANGEIELEQLQLLTDGHAASFKEQMVSHVENKYGLDIFQDMFGEVSSWEAQRTQGDEVAIETQEKEVELEQQITEAEGTLDQTDNPLENLSNVRSMGVLQLVAPKGIIFSNHSVQLADLPSKRDCVTGINSYQLNSNGVTDTLMVSDYILDHYKMMTDYIAVNDGVTPLADEGETDTVEQVSGLQYEVEYILGGKSSDQANLESVVNRLLVMRTAANYACLQTSATKKAEVSALALSIATASGMPLIQPILEQTLLLGWAYGESIVDVRGLLSGNRVSLIKLEADWQLDLSGLMTLGQEQEVISGKDMEQGLRYKEYLQILLCLENQESLVERGLDMIEQRMINQEGYTYFRVDYCVTQLQLQIVDTVQNRYTYEYPVAFTYH